MKSILILTTSLFFMVSSLYSRNYSKVYIDSNDSTKYYYCVAPDSQPVGLLILLPGARGNSEWPLKTTKIPYLAAEYGLATIMIDYETWLSWLHDDVLKLLNSSIKNVIQKYKIPTDKCVIGGFSSGGAMALNYTELAFKNQSKTAIVPAGVFGLDAPVDLSELYNVNLLEIQGFVCNGEKVKVSEETKNMYEKMNKYLGNTAENYENYQKYSPFIFNERYHSGGSAVYLKNVPVRIYSGISENYLQKKSECGFYLDSSPFLISFLKHKGNQKASFKSIYDDDYSPDGGENFRGRHAWLGFDSQECVNWIMNLIETNEK